MKFISIFILPSYFYNFRAILKNVKLYPQQLKVNQTIPCLFVSIKFPMGMGGGIKKQEFFDVRDRRDISSCRRRGRWILTPAQHENIHTPPRSLSTPTPQTATHTTTAAETHVNGQQGAVFDFSTFFIFCFFFFYFPLRFLPLRQLADNLFKAPDDSVNFLINIKYETLP